MVSYYDEFVVAEYRKDNLVLKICRDECPLNPREWDNLGTMVCWHRHYFLGDKHDYRTLTEFLEALAEEIGLENIEYETRQELLNLVSLRAVILPLYLYDHSGLTISTEPFSCSWDSGQVGWIYVTHDNIKKEYRELTPETIAKATKILEGEVEVYNQYLCGDVYGYVVEERTQCPTCGRINVEVIDSCWGFYGDDFKSNGLLDHANSQCDIDWEEVVNADCVFSE